MRLNYLREHIAFEPTIVEPIDVSKTISAMFNAGSNPEAILSTKEAAVADLVSDTFFAPAYL